MVDLTKFTALSVIKQTYTVVCHRRADGRLGGDFFEKGCGRLPGHGCLFIPL